MAIKEQIKRLERQLSGELEEAATVPLVLDAGHVVDIPANIYPQLMRDIEIIYGEPADGLRAAA